jgi:uncharacterized protein
MNISATYTFDAPVERVWDLLMDPQAVAACIPGCEALVPLGDDRYEASLSVAVAAITGRYKGTVAIVEKVPPSSYRLIVEGSGTPGFLKGSSVVTLAPDGAQTTINVEADVQIGGAVARVGQRLLIGVAKMMMDRFYACLGNRL